MCTETKESKPASLLARIPPCVLNCKHHAHHTAVRLNGTDANTLPVSERAARVQENAVTNTSLTLSCVLQPQDSFRKAQVHSQMTPCTLVPAVPARYTRSAASAPPLPLALVLVLLVPAPAAIPLLAAAAAAAATPAVAPTPPLAAAALTVSAPATAAPTVALPVTVSFTLCTSVPMPLPVSIWAPLVATVISAANMLVGIMPAPRIPIITVLLCISGIPITPMLVSTALVGALRATAFAPRRRRRVIAAVPATVARPLRATPAAGWRCSGSSVGGSGSAVGPALSCASEIFARVHEGAQLPPQRVTLLLDGVRWRAVVLELLLQLCHLHVLVVGERGVAASCTASSAAVASMRVETAE